MRCGAALLGPASARNRGALLVAVSPRLPDTGRAVLRELAAPAAGSRAGRPGGAPFRDGRSPRGRSSLAPPRLKRRSVPPLGRSPPGARAVGRARCSSPACAARSRGGRASRVEAARGAPRGASSPRRSVGRARGAPRGASSLRRSVGRARGAPRGASSPRRSVGRARGAPRGASSPRRSVGRARGAPRGASSLRRSVGRARGAPRGASSLRRSVGRARGALRGASSLRRSVGRARGAPRGASSLRRSVGRARGALRGASSLRRAPVRASGAFVGAFAVVLPNPSRFGAAALPPVRGTAVFSAGAARSLGAGRGALRADELLERTGARLGDAGRGCLAVSLTRIKSHTAIARSSSVSS
jgi:hypothetical protein